MTGRRWLIVAVLAATLVAAAGCGRVAGGEPVTLQITIHYSQFERRRSPCRTACRSPSCWSTRTRSSTNG